MEDPTLARLAAFSDGVFAECQTAVCSKF